MSDGERFLIDIAGGLWSGDAVPESYELTGRLDARNAKRVAEALAFVDEAADSALADGRLAARLRRDRLDGRLQARDVAGGTATVRATRRRAATRCSRAGQSTRRSSRPVTRK